MQEPNYTLALVLFFPAMLLCLCILGFFALAAVLLIDGMAQHPCLAKDATQFVNAQRRDLPRGVSFLIGFGRSGGFYVSAKLGLHVNLGWVAIHFLPFDQERAFVQAQRRANRTESPSRFHLLADGD